MPALCIRLSDDFDPDCGDTPSTSCNSPRLQPLIAVLPSHVVRNALDSRE